MATTEKRTVEDIVENEASGELGVAMSINDIKVACDNFVYGFRISDSDGSRVDWNAVEYMGVPRDFFELVQRVAAYEVRL